MSDAETSRVDSKAIWSRMNYIKYRTADIKAQRDALWNELETLKAKLAELKAR